ncbi:CGNR zinc finger domain-containing protein [Cohnella caldifontis]|uniref:CGNR zinc finger domain-containing protein n=1 Tax=Cohnella caldifontis TaxID=3027471 RepID=UPI0023EDE69A|nr:CGNR zinc finger domain-containing protein [Cohnella sp. YIM B05605]
MEPKIITLGGATWINLANTIVQQDHQRVDLLEDRDDAVQWLEGNGLLQGELPKDSGGDAIHDTLTRLRDICVDALSDLRREGRLSDQTIAKLEKESGALAVNVRMERENGVPRLIHEGRSLEDRVSYEVLRSLVDTLSQYPPERIRKCEHASCMLHFVDTSKSGKRRWCSMDLCGNRQKAADFYARKKERLGR